MKKFIKGTRIWLISHTRIIFLFLVSLVTLGYLVVMHFLSDEAIAHHRKVIDAFQPLAIGLGALLSGAAAFNYLDNWLRKQKIHQETVLDWRKRFPLSSLGKDFEVVQSEDKEGVLYIWDKKNHKKHWIIDPETLRWLSFNYSDVITLSSEDFAKIGRGDNVQATLT